MVILAYLCIQCLLYFTEKHVRIYEVEEGQISTDHEYTGLVLRKEKVVSAKNSGYINYYRQESSKIGKGDSIYSIDENGKYFKLITASKEDASSMTNEQLQDIADDIYGYINTYTNTAYSGIYTFKSQLNSKLSAVLSLEELNKLNDESIDSSSDFHIYTAIKDGVVEYYIDGYEAITPQTFTADDLNAINYSKNDLTTLESVEKGDAVYKLITNEKWNLVIKSSDDLTEKLKDEEYIQVKFLKDDVSVWGNISFRQIDNENYLIITFQNSMIRYASERFLSVDITLEEESGLKIPNSAIVEKKFFKIPSEYFIKGNDSDDLGLLVKNTEDNSTSFVKTTIYYEDENNNYYIDENDITAGTIIVKSSSSDTYTVKSTGTLSGVYNINKGYAVFKQIEIKSQNEEYSIIAKDTSYGISLYDHIALDSSTISEGELVN